jgi:two-component system, NarL family, sensor histidine kinase DesK
MIPDEESRAAETPTIAGVLYELPRWAHFIWLIYLGFLFTPLLEHRESSLWLWPTLLSLPVFLYLYTRVVRQFRHGEPPGLRALPEVLVLAVLAYSLLLVNDAAQTYLIYCMAIAPFAVPRFRQMLLLVVLLLAVYALEMWLLKFNAVSFGITAIVGIAASASNFMMVENRRKNIALRLSREEVHRLGRVAERERIGRDLHDLLGHTLSLIAIKSELAGKLLDRDRAAAAREVAEVTNIAREALKQVRTAVAGIRSAALESELTSARALLGTAGVELTFERDGAVLSAEIETALAMIVREAVTNIQRHAGARRARIEVVTQSRVLSTQTGLEEKMVVLSVKDDGRGGITTSGNGLAGIGERVRSLGGTLEIDSPRDKGTVLTVRLPLMGPPSSGRGGPEQARAAAA